MKATVKWVGEVGFAGESETGHTIMMDGAPEHGGRDRGARPMELVLIGTGGCSAFDVVHILRKAHQDVRDCVLTLDAERAADDPKVFIRIHMHFTVTGKGLNPAQVKRAIELSAEKYCSASIMLAKTAQITHDFEIVDAP